MYALAIALLAFSTFVSNAFANKEYLLLDIRDATTSEIISALRDVEIELKVKAKGIARHLIVVKQNDANLQKLGEIDIPGRSCSTPVEDLDNLMEDIGISWPRNELTSVNVTLFERTLDLKDKTMEQFWSEAKAYGQLVKPVLSSFTYRAFKANGAYPPKVYFFVNLPRENLNDASSKGIDIFGGPGKARTTVQYISVCVAVSHSTFSCRQSVGDMKCMFQQPPVPARSSGRPGRYDNQVRHGVRIAAPVMENFPNYILLSKGTFPPKSRFRSNLWGLVNGSRRISRRGKPLLHNKHPNHYQMELKYTIATH
uniref:Perivitellin ovorubin-3 n=1 Tax=Pomacea canaliculata TaxID=400727 RepID=J7I5Z5_POMCA|nr:perivitellin ovorubin-3 [Pomacea canaliculata]